jgi:hypothetical protein
MHKANHNLIRCALASTLALAIALGGCSRWNWRGPGFDDQTSGWTSKLRPAADEKQLTGLDARAQEIERNLGVR